MTRLWTNDPREALDYWCGVCVGGQCEDCQRVRWGAVRVLDPDDDELVERVAAVVVEELQLVDANPERLARAVIVALRQP